MPSSPASLLSASQPCIVQPSRQFPSNLLLPRNPLSNPCQCTCPCTPGWCWASRSSRTSTCPSTAGGAWCGRTAWAHACSALTSPRAPRSSRSPSFRPVHAPEHVGGASVMVQERFMGVPVPSVPAAAQRVLPTALACRRLAICNLKTVLYQHAAMPSSWRGARALLMPSSAAAFQASVP